VKLLAEYVLDSIRFRDMAKDAKDPDVRAAFERQSEDFWKLAVKRAMELGIAIPQRPDEK